MNDYSNIVWRCPTLEDILKDREELELTLQLFLKQNITDEAIHQLAFQLLEGKYLELTDEAWSQLENTDSWSKIKPGDMDTVRCLSAGYERDVGSILLAIESGQPLPAPTILEYNHRFYKVSGNTRLMVARALNQHPMVLLGLFS